MRPVNLPHHRTCGFQHPAVARRGLTRPQDPMVGEIHTGAGSGLLSARCNSGCLATPQPPRLLVAPPGLCRSVPRAAASVVSLNGCAISTRSTSGCVCAPVAPGPGAGHPLRPVASTPTNLAGTATLRDIPSQIHLASPSFANLADRGVDGEAPQASQASGSGSDARVADHR